MDSLCRHCEARLIPLFHSFICSADCDRVLTDGDLGWILGEKWPEGAEHTVFKFLRSIIQYRSLQNYVGTKVAFKYEPGMRWVEDTHGDLVLNIKLEVVPTAPSSGQALPADKDTIFVLDIDGYSAARGWST